MSDAPPSLAEIPKTSDLNIPTMNSMDASHSAAAPSAAPESTSATNGTTLKDTVMGHASNAYNTVSSHPTTQNVKETVVNGPVGSAVQDQSAKTGADLSNLAGARAPPSQPAATGQPLTNYHSFFYSLLTWEHKRATAIAFASTLAFIFACRYLKLLRFVFKTSYIVLGVTAAAEVAGKLVLGNGLTSSFRPRRYYTIPRETLEATLDDVEQLINFFVIETQRLVFAERPEATLAAFFAALTSYFLIRFTPFWGLCLIGTCVLYLTPLVYLSNKELIDHHIGNAQSTLNAQSSQLKDLAGQHTSRAASTMKQYTGDYTAKAQQMLGTNIGQSRQKIVKEQDFPNAPQTDIAQEKPATTSTAQPVAAI